MKTELVSYSEVDQGRNIECMTKHNHSLIPYFGKFWCCHIFTTLAKMAILLF